MFSILFVLMKPHAQTVSKNFIMYDLNGSYVNSQKDVNKKGIRHEIQLFLKVKKSTFKSTKYIGSIKIDDAIYKVKSVSSYKDGQGTTVQFIKDEEKFTSFHFLFSLTYKNNFSIIIIRSNDYVLSGPAESIEEAYKLFLNVLG